MPSKTEEYLALAQRTANGLTRYWESWTDYLTTASRLYKYPFADQLMIYAQRPDATACAEFDIWRNRMNRYVRRGSKGIALLDESSGFPRLHYVFDVSDTGVRRNSRDPEVWQLGPDLVQPVSEMLAATYGISGERVSQQLADVAGKLVADYWDNNGGDIRAIVDGSLLMDYDEAGVEMQFKSAAAISVTYTLLERCGFEPAGWFDKDDFQAIYNFSTPDSVYALGAAVSDMSREVLRNIERTVKTTIRRRNAERSQYEYEQQERDLFDHRGLPAPEPDAEPAPEAAGQVRQAAPDVPEGPSPGAVQHDAPEREPVPEPVGGEADGREPDAADHGTALETDPGPGQGEESAGVGTAHEQPESAGRGTGADGTDLQLSFFDAHIPTEAQQIETIDQAESEKSPSAFVLSQAEIENELRKHGSGFAGGKQRIMALYQTQPDRNLRAKALAKEYGTGGHSHDFLDGSRGFVNHDGRGIRKSRISSLRLPDGETRRKGARTTKNLWVSKLRCRCGSSYRIFNWRKLKDGTPVFGYQCNMRTVNPTRSFVLEHNMTQQLSCDAISIPEWKLELMAKKIFEKVWGNQNKAILRACKMIESCQNGKAATQMSAAPIQSKIEKIKKRKLNYAAMRADGELPREEYQALCKQADDEIAHLEQELKALSPAPEPQMFSSDMKAIYDFLSQKVDVHGARLAPELIDQFVEVVTPIADYSYRWKLNTGCKKSKEERTNLMVVSEKPILTFTIDFETAKRYREANKMPHQFRRAAWTDLTVEVYL